MAYNQETYQLISTKVISPEEGRSVVCLDDGASSSVWSLFLALVLRETGLCDGCREIKTTTDCGVQSTPDGGGRQAGETWESSWGDVPRYEGVRRDGEGVCEGGEEEEGGKE